jgi:hypothetical protein
MSRKSSSTLASLLLALPCLSIAAGMPPNQAGMTAKYLLAAKDGDLPMSKDDLFGDPDDEVKPVTDKESLPLSKDALFGDLDEEPKPAKAESGDKLPDSKEALFGDVPDADDKTRTATPAGAAPAATETAESKAGLFDDKPEPAQAKAPPPASPVRGYFQTELARTVGDPDHWSKVTGRLELGTQGRLGQGARWKVSGRVDYNAVYDLTDFYQSQVRDDQRAEFHLRETYVDFSAADWEWRVGRQHIVWGEMVGLFFADVVSAKDLREFILPDFQILRIPQWAARAEYYGKNDFHAELIWIPIPSYDRVGKPGADFYPYPPSAYSAILKEDKPGNSLSHTNYGVRVSKLTQGWDLSGFYYSSMNNYPTWYPTPTPDPAIINLTPKHDRIWQMGGTLGKDMGNFVLKAEAVYTNGRRPNLVSEVGVVKQNTLDWAVGLDFNPGDDTRVNTQLYQSYTFDHHADTIPDRAESGVSVLVNHKFPNNWQAELLVVRSLNRNDWMARPKAVWGFQPNWRLTFGLDLFDGPPDGLFGQHAEQDRVYAEVRYDF